MLQQHTVLLQHPLPQITTHARLAAHAPASKQLAAQYVAKSAKPTTTCAPKPAVSQAESAPSAAGSSPSNSSSVRPAAVCRSSSSGDTKLCVCVCVCVVSRRRQAGRQPRRKPNRDHKQRAVAAVAAAAAAAAAAAITQKHETRKHQVGMHPFFVSDDPADSLAAADRGVEAFRSAIQTYAVFFYSLPVFSFHFPFSIRFAHTCYHECSNSAGSSTVKLTTERPRATTCVFVLFLFLFCDWISGTVRT